MQFGRNKVFSNEQVLPYDNSCNKLCIFVGKLNIFSGERVWKEIWKTQILCKIEKEMRKRVLLQKEELKIGQSSGRMSPCKREREEEEVCGK